MRKTLRTLLRPLLLPIRPIKRYIAEQKKIIHFEKLQNPLFQLDVNTIYSETNTRKRLWAKRERRVSFKGKNRGIQNIVCFGLESWEQYGLWSSFSRMKVKNVSFCSLGDLSKKHGITSVGLKQRETLCQACLDYIDGLCKENPVDLAFFYVDTECLMPVLFQELDKRGIWSVLMGLDDKHRFWPRKENGMMVGQATVTAYVDLMWTTWKIGADIILQHGGTPWYAPEAADPSFFHPMDLMRDIDILFIGQKYGERQNLINYLCEKGFRVKAFGRGWPGGFVTFKESINLINRAKVILGIGGVGGLPNVQHLKGRDFEVPMCGAVYLTTYNPELADWFEIGKEILCYSSPQNCAEILHWILRRPEEQEAIRKAALARSLREHTWETRLKQMLAIPNNG